MKKRRLDPGIVAAIYSLATVRNALYDTPHGCGAALSAGASASQAIRHQDVHGVSQPMKTLGVMVFATFFAAMGDVLLSQGMKEVGDISQLPWNQMWRILVMFGNTRVLLGILCMAVFFFSYAASLSWADLSLALPSTALSFVFGTLIALLWLGERVSSRRLLGVMIIALGVLVVWLDAFQLTAGGRVRQPRAITARE
jgi:drug/metabolite transporter (DMT)-like permease